MATKLIEKALDYHGPTPIGWLPAVDEVKSSIYGENYGRIPAFKSFFVKMKINLAKVVGSLYIHPLINNIDLY